MIWLLVFVICGVAIAFGPGWFEVHEGVTLADPLEQVTGQKYLETGVSVKTTIFRLSELQLYLVSVVR